MLHLETSLEVFWETVTVQRVPLVLLGRRGTRRIFITVCCGRRESARYASETQSAENARKRLFQGSARSSAPPN